MKQFERLAANVLMAGLVAGLTALSVELSLAHPKLDRAGLIALGVVVVRAAIGAALVALKKPLPVDKPPEV